jgi:transposase
MARYKEPNRGPGQFIAVDLSRQILPGSYEETPQYLIDRKIDLSKFDAEYRNDETGAPAISPRVLLKVVLYCYSRGLITSRPMARARTENRTVKALAEDTEPYFSVIAGFISKNSEKMKDVFTQALLYCSELGLIKGDLFATDGYKLPSNASKEWSGTIDELKKKKADLAALSSRLIEKHKKLDAEDKNNSDLGKEERTAAKERRKRHIERINKKMEYIDQFFADDPRPRLGTRYEARSNITDNESAKIKGPHGVIQGYNGIAVADGANQVIVAADVAGSVYEGNEIGRASCRERVYPVVYCLHAPNLPHRRLLSPDSPHPPPQSHYTPESPRAVP